MLQKIKLLDSHCHLDDAKLAKDLLAVLERAAQNGLVGMATIGCDLRSSLFALHLAEKYPQVTCAVGVHPSDCGELNEKSFADLAELAAAPAARAVGEIGLDYYWDKDEEVKRSQRYWFCRQMELAREQELPVIIHSRDAAEDTLKLVQGIHGEQIPGVIHCFSYSPEQAFAYIKMGYYIGIGGVVTFKNARKLKETAAAIPLEHILLETDCPYLSPEPERGKRNSSLNLPYVAQEIARLRGITQEEVMEVTRENARRLFSRVR